MASSNHTAQSYIVVLKPGVPSSKLKVIQHSAAELELATRKNLSPRGFELSSESFIKGSYNLETFKGFNGHFCQETIDKITAFADVDYIEPDGFTTIQGSDDPNFVTDSFSLPGLSTISHRHPTPAIANSFIYHKSAGTGITVYVIDTGIMTSHDEFEGRATLGKNLVDGTPNTDTCGHGTHVAGSIIGKSFGAARNASVISVKAYDPETPGAAATCPNSRLLAALVWVLEDAKLALQTSILNLSAGNKYSKVLNQAFSACVSSGLVCIVAAANFGIDLAGTSPASADGVFSVGAVYFHVKGERDFKRLTNSNFGASLGIFAPGFQITSCAIHSETAIAELTGTSMACAYVSGVTAYLMSYQKLASPTVIYKSLCGLSSKGLIPNPGNNLTPNRFLYNGGMDIF